MPLQGKIGEFHHPRNLFKLVINSVFPPPPGDLTIIRMSGLKTERETVQMPDRTIVAGGQVKPFTFTIVIPTHHTLEMAFWTAWFKQCEEPVDRFYKKDGTLLMPPLGPNPTLRGGTVRAYSLTGLHPNIDELSDFDMKNEGEMSELTITMNCDRKEIAF